MISADALWARYAKEVYVKLTADRFNDTVTDRDTAVAAGVPSILVTFGPSGANTAALSPQALLHDFADLQGVVAEVLA